ncbi:hypothetical protein BS47DRAFT_1338225 [Hydnum rufescens UP504]|uniref:Six-hairpin glycosidase n=1 Tax=Hydnum rufescens UP504 TaxID=1448309 RepID=A0A9P6B7S7_9AGAM|nr:hypothetical protein BS47DRAFT_1338225 [Hydnum rufescens UP504]
MLSLLFVSAAAFALASPLPASFSDNQIDLVKARLAESASHSWEIGTRATALLELEGPSLFVYSQGSTPPPKIYASTGGDVFKIVDDVLAKRAAGNCLPFFCDGSAGDPASIGIPDLIRNWTHPSPTSNSSSSTAAIDQLHYLIDIVPRLPDGAISHRSPPQPVQLWSDFLSMAPPFIAYYGALHNNKSLLLEAYNQIKTYRYHLTVDDDSGLLQHIVLGKSGSDPGHWATGNGWAASGMLRVLRIIQSSAFAEDLLDEQADIISWASSLLNTVWQYQQPDGSLLNYIDLSPRNTFPDASGTALLAASTFRLATILPGSVDTGAAERARKWIGANIDKDGWLTNVVNPLNWHKPGSHSPEGQAFVLMLAAAYRDFSLV